MDICLRMLKESNKSRFDSYSVRNSVLIISHITFQDCRVHIFTTTFLEIAACILRKQAARVSKTGHEHSVNISRILSLAKLWNRCNWLKFSAGRRYNCLCNHLNALLIYLVSGMAGEA